MTLKEEEDNKTNDTRNIRKQSNIRRQMRRKESQVDARGNITRREKVNNTGLEERDEEG